MQESGRGRSGVGECGVVSACGGSALRVLSLRGPVLHRLPRPKVDAEETGGDGPRQDGVLRERVGCSAGGGLGVDG